MISGFGWGDLGVCAWMFFGWGLGLLVCGGGGFVCWFGLGMVCVGLSDAWFGFLRVFGLFGLDWVLDEPESLILAQSERWRHA